MRITYDSEVDALCIYFREGCEVTTKHVAEGVAIDIEILDARKRFGDPDVFRKVVLEDSPATGL